MPALEVAREYAILHRVDPSIRHLWNDLIRQVALSEEMREPVTVAELALDGRALISLGIPPGREVGRVLSCLLEAVLCDPERNTPAALSALVRELRNGRIGVT